MNKLRSNDFQEHLEKYHRDPKALALFNEYGKQLEIAYQLLRLRKKQQLSQAEVAKKLGTTQGNVARMEGGRQNFSVATLVKLAEIFGKDLVVSFK